MNSQKEILDAVKDILADLGREKDTGKITPNSTLGSDLDFDSLAAIELVHALEDKFKIEIPDQNFNSSITVAKLADYIASEIENNPNTAGHNPPASSTKLTKKDFLNSLSVDKSVLSENRFNPYYQNVESALGRTINIAGKELISLGSNDYLGLANNPTIKNEAVKIIEQYGMSMCSTPIVLGQTKINRSLEIKLAKFLKQDDCLLYPTGYQANMAIFHILAKDSDIILADRNIHSSLINGCMLSRAALRFFSHNDTDNLEALLKNTLKYRMRFIVIEGLYSTDGDTAPLERIVKLSQKYAGFIIMDDAHGIGVLGSEGRGSLEKFNCFEEVDLTSGSLGKALGLFGGFLAGNSEIIDYFRYNSPMYFYSTALPPYIAAAGIAALEFVRKHNDLRIKICGFKDKIYQALNKLGYRLTPSQTPLFSIIFKNSSQTLRFTKLLFEKGIYVVPFIPPSVPADSPRIRLLPTAYLKDEDIEKVISVFNDLKDEYAGR